MAINTSSLSKFHLINSQCITSLRDVLAALVCKFKEHKLARNKRDTNPGNISI